MSISQFDLLANSIEFEFNVFGHQKYFMLEYEDIHKQLMSKLKVSLYFGTLFVIPQFNSKKNF